MATAIAASYPEPSFFISAGAILTTVFRPGIENPLRCMAVVTLSRDSLTALSGNPTRKIPTPGLMDTSTVTLTTSRPTHVALNVLHKEPLSLITEDLTGAR